MNFAPDMFTRIYIALIGLAAVCGALLAVALL